MMKYLVSTCCLMLLLFWPTQAQEIATSTISTTSLSNTGGEAPLVPAVPARLSTAAETNYLNELAHRGLRLETQGLLIESLNGSSVFADLNSTVGFNPASVIKLATTLAALTKFGADYQFETAVYSRGVLNRRTRTLAGDLIIASSGDPNLSTTDVNKLIRQVIRSGVARVSGSVFVIGPFAYGNYYTNERATRALTLALRRLGVRVAGGVKASDAGIPSGTRIAGMHSTSLREIVFFQNAYSSNPIAERLGNSLGGPKAVEQFLVDHVGIPQADVYVGRTSGLDFNRITARGTVELLRHIMQWVEANNLRPEDIMPVAGVDPGTLHRRFRTDQYRGTVVAKTGTLPATDGGVSTLAGILYTRDSGTVLFAIFNTRLNVNTARMLQDSLLKNVLTEFGSAPPISASSRRLNN